MVPSPDPTLEWLKLLLPTLISVFSVVGIYVRISERLTRLETLMEFLLEGDKPNDHRARPR